jgi:hypothetical protein
MLLSSSSRSSAGLSLGGFVGVLAILSLVGLLAMKIIPAYIEFHSVKASFNELSTQSFKSESEVRRSIGQKFSVNYVSSINDRDVDISRTNGAYALSVDYDVVKPIIGNVSVDVHFAYDVTTQANRGD